MPFLSERKTILIFSFMDDFFKPVSFDRLYRYKTIILKHQTEHIQKLNNLCEYC